MTYLQLCQRWALEASINGSGSGMLPISTAGQTGQLLRGINWVATAWDYIQKLSNDWRFMWVQFTFTLQANGRIYDPMADWGLDNVNYWAQREARLYPTAMGLASEFKCHYLKWDQFYQQFGVGVINPSRPLFWTVRPDGKVEFSTPLDQQYQFSNEYFRTVQELAADADVPLIDSQFQIAIVYKALMFYAEYYEAGSLFATAKRNYDNEMGTIRQKYLPEAFWGAPLA